MDTQQPANTTPPRLQPLHVLVVDDHPNTANMLARALSQMSARVDAVAVSSGHEAYEHACKHGVDILITDMVMPGMTGMELVEKLQAHPGSHPTHVILITAYEVPGLKEAARRLKVNQVLAKPVRPERICQIVSDTLKDWDNTKRSSRAGQAREKTFKLLIADDHPDNVTLLARYLKSEGHEYITAKDGVEALEKVRTEFPDLVLMDVNMPNKDGFATLEEIRADPSIQHIPVILLTAARLDSMDIQSGLNLGADDYVTKPFDRHELMARIRTKLRVKEAEDGLRRRDRELTMLLEVAGILNTREKLDAILDNVVRLILRRLGASEGHFLFFETGAIKSFPDSAARINSSLMKEHLITNPRINGICIDKVPEDAFWRAVLGDPALSAIFVPLRDRHGAILGAILLTHIAYGYFDLEHIPILQTIANQVIVTMENMAWYESLRRVPL